MKTAAPPSRYDAFDLLATMVAVVKADGALVFVNARFEDVASLSRRTLMRGSLFDWFADTSQLRETLAAVTGNEIADTDVDGVRIGVTSIASLMQRITVGNNTIRNLTGIPINNLLGDPASVSCSGNTANGKAVGGACKTMAFPAVVGAKLNCGLIP